MDDTVQKNNPPCDTALSDFDLESRIDNMYIMMRTAPTIEECAKYWVEMKKLCAQRSPKQVRKMEEERGLI